MEQKGYLVNVALVFLAAPCSLLEQNGPDQHHNTLRVLPNDKIDQLNESLEERVDPPPSYQTLFRHRQQLDDDLRPDSSNSDEMNDDDDKSPTNGKAGAAAHPPL